MKRINWSLIRNISIGIVIIAILIYIAMIFIPINNECHECSKEKSGHFYEYKNNDTKKIYFYCDDCYKNIPDMNGTKDTIYSKNPFNSEIKSIWSIVFDISFIACLVSICYDIKHKQEVKSLVKEAEKKKD
ncbi:MAG: hypothetical protein J6L69_01355 [Lachnospiraceae bacterium]|nr:hypothetical protein [Lachnospiraceae bacterium]